MDKERQALCAVVSNTPGRLRVRVHRQHRDPHLMHRVHAQLTAHPHIKTVYANPSSGSVLVHYDPHAHSFDAILAALHDLGVIVGDVVRSEEVKLVTEAGQSKAATSVLDALGDLDSRVAHLTGHHVDLKLLFPVSL